MKTTIASEKEKTEPMKIGDKIHYFWRRYGELLNEWDGYIVGDCSGLGDGKRKIWGISRINKFEDYDKKGYLCASEEDLRKI